MYDVPIKTRLGDCHHCQSEYLNELRESRPELFTKLGRPKVRKWQELKELDLARGDVRVPCVVFTEFDSVWCEEEEALVICKRHFKQLHRYFAKQLDKLET